MGVFFVPAVAQSKCAFGFSKHNDGAWGVPHNAVHFQ